MTFLAWLESMRISTWVREGEGIWGYPIVLFAHTLGMAALVGLNAVIDLRLLGFAPATPIRPLQRLLPLIWVGFAVNLISGVLLLIADATTKLTNPVFYVKLVCIAGALAALLLIKRDVFASSRDSDATTTRVRLLAVASLALWACAIMAGRLMAYIGNATGPRSIT
jgi:hypothetical protein